MKEPELLAHMAKNGGEAKVKTEESLQAAMNLETAGLVKKVGTYETSVIFRFTETGFKTMKKDGSSAFGTIRKAWHAFQDYAESYRGEHPVGLGEIGKLSNIQIGHTDEFDATKVYVSKKEQSK